MAGVRELVTAFTFKVDQTGINQYQSAIAGIKNTAKTLAGVFGLAFGLEKIYSFVDGLITAGKESNKLIYQIQRLGRGGDDLSNIQDTLLQSALKLGVAYQDVGQTFKSLLIDSQGLKISQDSLLSATENIYKAFRVGRLGPEQMKEATDAIDSALKRGAFSTRTLGRLEHISPDIIKVMADAMTGGDIPKLKAMAHQKGGITVEAFIQGMARPNEQLNADFAKAPVKLGTALVNIYSQLTVAAGKLWKMIDNSAMLGKVVTNAFNLAVKAVKAFVDAVGGADNALRIVGITLGVLAAAKILPWIYSLITGMNLLSLSAWRAALPFLAWAAAIGAVVLVLDDLYVWMTGGKSMIGSWVGPFEDIKKTLTEFWDESKLTAPFRTLISLFQGDFKGAWENLKASFTDEGIFVTLLAGIAAVGTAFKLWELIKFVGLTAELIGLTTKTGAVETAAKGTAAAFAAVDKIKFTGLLASLGLVGAGVAAIWGLLMLGSKYETPEARAATEQRRKDMQTTPTSKLQTTDKYFRNGKWYDSSTGVEVQAPPDNLEVIPSGPGSEQKPRLEIPPSSSSYENIPTPKSTSVSPGAVAPVKVESGPVDNSQNPTLNQTNNVAVTMNMNEQQIADVIKGILPGLANDAINVMARQLAGAAPATERRAQ